MKWDSELVDNAVRRVIETSKLAWPQQEVLYSAWDTYRDRFDCEPNAVSSSAAVLLKFLRATEEVDETSRLAIEALERWVIIPKNILISAKESAAAAKLLEWAGLTEIWKKYRLLHVASPLDIAARCLNVHIGRRTIESGSNSGISLVTILANRPEQFRAELRRATAKLLWEWRRRG
jgi:hypothetical protein